MTDDLGPFDERTEQTLQDLVRFAAAAARLVNRGRAAYDTDEALRLAAEAIVHKLGEAVSRLPNGLIAAHPEVPWRQIKAMRNLVAHRYEQVSYGLLWNTLANDLPRDAQQIQRILDTAEAAH